MSVRLKPVMVASAIVIAGAGVMTSGYAPYAPESASVCRVFRGRETVFPFFILSALRADAARATSIPPDNELEKVREVWRKSPLDPMDLLRVFPALRLKSGFVLRAYVFGDAVSGIGRVYGMPVDATFPEPKDCPRQIDIPMPLHPGELPEILRQPVPPGAVADVMEVIQGDGSRWSYMCASIFARELRELGAWWHGVWWGTHTIVGKFGAWWPQLGRNWTWLEPLPNEWRPSVAERNGRVTVTFYSYSGRNGERIVRHVDTYEPGSYRFTSRETVIAKGGAGYMF